jgi:hypothetical protein
VSCSQAWKRKTLEEAARSCDDREKALKEWERRVRSERDEAKKMRDAAEKESTAAKAATEDSVKRKRDAEKKTKECDKIKEEFKIKETRFESECTQRLDKMTADELALAQRSNDLEAAAMDVAAQVAAAAESRTESEAVLKACENEKERLEALDAHLEKENARVNAQRTVVERAFEDAQEERRIIAEAAEEADVVRRQLEESANDLDAKHAEADARQQVLDEVTVLHQQWEKEQGEREKHASDTLEVAEAAERKAEEQATRAKVEREAMERARKAFEESELALDERERKLAHTWQTIRTDAHRISTASYRASIGAQRSQGRIIEAKAEMSRLFGPGDESEDHVASVPTSPLAPPPTPGGDLAAATAARKALLASFDAGEPTVAAPARASYPSDHAVSEMLGAVEYDTYSLEDDARVASAAHDMLPADPSSTPGLIEPRVDETDAVVRVALAVVPVADGTKDDRSLRHVTMARLMEKKKLVIEKETQLQRWSVSLDREGARQRRVAETLEAEMSAAEAAASAADIRLTESKRLEEANHAAGEFFFIISVWAIRLTACFVYRYRPND